MQITQSIVERAREVAVGSEVVIRRTSGAPQAATVISVCSGREFMAPEVPTFRVTWPTPAGPAFRWCSAFDMLDM